jgi:hypothetical protein
MRHIDYLEAIKTDILSELFNVDVQKLSLTKITFNQNKVDSLALLEGEMKRLSKSTLSEGMKLPEKTVISYIKKNSDPEDIKGIIEVYNILKGIKSGTTYIYLNNDLAIAKSFVFFVNETLYGLDLGEGQDVDILFDEFGANYMFQQNSIMSTSGGSDLFNKIATIIKKEIPGWTTKVFSFASASEPSERANQGKLNIALRVLVNVLKKYLTVGIQQADLTKIRKELGKVDNIKNKLKNDLLEKIPKNVDYVNFINFIFSDETFKSLPPVKKQVSSLSGVMLSKINRLSTSSVYTKNTVRNRLYRMVIKQMFGSKVFINDEGSTRMLFSLSKENLDKVS